MGFFDDSMMEGTGMRSSGDFSQDIIAGLLLQRAHDRYEHSLERLRHRAEKGLGKHRSKGTRGDDYMSPAERAEAEAQLQREIDALAVTLPPLDKVLETADTVCNVASPLLFAAAVFFFVLSAVHCAVAKRAREVANHPWTVFHEQSPALTLPPMPPMQPMMPLSSASQGQGQGGTAESAAPSNAAATAPIPSPSTPAEPAVPVPGYVYVPGYGYAMAPMASAPAGMAPHAYAYPYAQQPMQQTQQVMQPVMYHYPRYESPATMDGSSSVSNALRNMARYGQQMARDFGSSVQGIFAGPGEGHAMPHRYAAVAQPARAMAPGYTDNAPPAPSMAFRPSTATPISVVRTASAPVLHDGGPDVADTGERDPILRDAGRHAGDAVYFVR
jgi:hypothetical protein